LWDRSIAADGTAIESVVHVTMPGNELLREIHNTGANPYRMPTILREADHEAWLNGSMEEARAALQAYPSGLMGGVPGEHTGQFIEE
jgi:putative SOS response-associated peptidase YedK